MEATAAASSGGSFYTTDGGEVDRNNSSSSSSSSWSWSWSSQQQLWQQWQSRVWSKSQQWLDRCTPYPLWRWLATLAVACVYCIRVLVFLQGFYIVTYGLGIYLLNLLIGFLSPQLDPDTQAPSLPTKATDEFKPFLRRLPEFKFWYSLTKAICIAFVMTFFSVFDVPVFWPILLLYWILLFVLTMKRQMRHMIKYKYVPFDFGKQRYAGKAATSEKDFKKLQEDITTSGIKDNTDAEASG